MGKTDTELLDAVGSEVSDMRDANGTPANREVKYEPRAVTREGRVD